MLNINLISALWVELWSTVEAASAVLLPWAVVALAGVLAAPVQVKAAKARGVANEGILVARPAAKPVVPYSTRALEKARARMASGRQRPGAPILEHI
jgi:hypothetical protein